MQLVKYEAACSAIAAARSVDEVKEFMAGAQAARAYARQAKNRQLELDALEIRIRAERRLGEIIIGLKQDKKLRVQGVRDWTPRGHEMPLRLSDLGIDAEDSGRAQRLAAVQISRFEQEIAEWRRAGECAQRVEVPLQHIRIPTLKADRQRVRKKMGRPCVDQGDRFAMFVSIDGRRVADWRIGELERLEAIFKRLWSTVSRLRGSIPIANPDPLATIENTFKSDELASILESTWGGLPQSNAGLAGQRTSSSRASRTRICENCASQFVMDARRNTAGRFCSRSCSVAFRRKN